jgi:hypothetical protein
MGGKQSYQKADQADPEEPLLNPAKNNDDSKIKPSKTVASKGKRDLESGVKESEPEEERKRVSFGRLMKLGKPQCIFLLSSGVSVTVFR